MNIREVMRRLIKYLIMVLVVAFACFTLVKTSMTNFEIILIALISGMIYNVLDLMSPSIDLKIDKTCGI
tara:strand:+ start:739 stop:945 length:207 start_codon:yes stop_codon:yes gene_type:complete